MIGAISFNHFLIGFALRKVAVVTECSCGCGAPMRLVLTILEIFPLPFVVIALTVRRETEAA